VFSRCSVRRVDYSRQHSCCLVNQFFLIAFNVLQLYRVQLDCHRTDVPTAVVLMRLLRLHCCCYIIIQQQAILFTRGHDVENEAIALSKLGTLYANVMSLKELALRCSSQVSTLHTHCY
jgi:hypothetical protein